MPHREEDLPPEKIAFVHGTKDLFFLSGISRKLERYHYLADYNAPNNIDWDSLIKLKLSSDAEPIGTYSSEGQEYLVFSKGQDDKGSILDFISLSTGQSYQIVDLIDLIIQKGTLKQSSKSLLWLSYKNRSESTSAIDEPLRFVSLRKNKIDISIESRLALEFPGESEFFVNSEEQLIILSSPKDTPHLFEVSIFDRSANKILQHQFKDIASSKIESWTGFLSKKNHLYLALVSGNSLFGDAVLKIFSYDMGQSAVNKLFDYEIPLGNSHIGDYQWLDHKGELVLLIPRWLDKESILSAYRFDQTGFKNKTNFGYFQEGTQFKKIFTVSDSANIGLLTQESNKTGSSHKMCLLDTR